ncbi:hypothetical protein DY000_02014188 [Brassica cretica]|uniref:Uncharacterized protein n=1 Tax=Brassica cretica TaxID=69181 RepID=A0ABQ7CWY0_BRACR|nr:hypothetical protein DY000_02014193 [Brassica cretica]KAF3567460.1 hypothetical protein DY000_02014188 [Brassica cretica]
MKKDAILECFTRNSRSEQPEDCSLSRTAERLFPKNKETSKILSGVCPSYPIPPWRLSTPPYKNTTLSIFTFYASFCKRLRLVFGDCNFLPSYLVPSESLGSKIDSQREQHHDSGLIQWSDPSSRWFPIALE